MCFTVIPFAGQERQVQLHGLFTGTPPPVLSVPQPTLQLPRCEACAIQVLQQETCSAAVLRYRQAVQSCAPLFCSSHYRSLVVTAWDCSVCPLLLVILHNSQFPFLKERKKRRCINCSTCCFTNLAFYHPHSLRPLLS